MPFYSRQATRSVRGQLTGGSALLASRFALARNHKAAAPAAHSPAYTTDASGLGARGVEFVPQIIASAERGSRGDRRRRSRSAPPVLVMA
jgi:hypothetical protein